MNAELQSLGRRLVGRWTTEATHPALPGTVISGSSQVEWLEGERFLIHRIQYHHPDIPDAISIINFSSALLSICGRGPESRFRQWLHPPVSKRVEFLRLAFVAPERAVAFRLRFCWIAAAILALHAAAALLAAFACRG